MLHFGREIAGDFALASRREWLVTNGLGGWASGTVSGANTRRYHGLFVPALQPPLGRTVLVSKLNDWASTGGQRFALSSNEYADGTIDPQGYRQVERFGLEGTVPVWRYAVADALLEKRIWMPAARNAVFVTYTLARGMDPIQLDVLVMVTARDAHGETRHEELPDPEVTVLDHGALVRGGGLPLRLAATGGAFSPERLWHFDVKHRAETERGLPDREDQFAAGRFTVELSPGQSWALTATLETEPDLDWEHSLRAERARGQALVKTAGLEGEPEWIQQLVLAADQFLVQRGSGQTIIAGYHWFGDWGRDTMIALPGLALATGRYEAAADILRTFGHFMSQGMLPNRFPDAGGVPEYNTVDATLWYFHAIDRYLAATDDTALAAELLPQLEDSIGWHLHGTRFGIGVDPADGLLRSGEAGIQLTWMDAKVGEEVITPRTGKAVEINALWINALRSVDRLCQRLGLPPAHPYGRLAAQAAAQFERFWYADGNYLYDVVDGPQGDDASLRPNQVLAIALPYAPLRTGALRGRARSVLRAVARDLLTSFGLRTLSPRDPNYQRRFEGAQARRDRAYHQGTVWAWLMGPFVDAHLWAFGEPDTARSFLAPFESQLADYGVGSVAEIFQPEAPFEPCGAIAQAWSVAELLRAWKACGPISGDANITPQMRRPNSED